MQCPRDGTALQKVNVLGVDLDKCHKCDGIWFDRGEMERLQETKISDVEEVLESKYGDPVYAEGEKTDYMRCPRCNGRLRGYTYSYVKPVKLDSCEKCYGIWVDDGELDKIIGQKKQLDEEYSLGRFEGVLRSLSNLIRRKDQERNR